MEYFEAFGCHNAQDMNACALRVLDEVPNVNYLAIQTCMKNSGGLSGNVGNTHLQAHLDAELTSHLPYGLEDLPFMRLAGENFTDGDVSDVFHWVCGVFQEYTV
jgi:hypothetical protein